VRYIQVTHTYVLPVPDDDCDPAELDPVMNAGVSIMERHIKKHGAAVLELSSDWTIMPKEYQPPSGNQSDVSLTPAISKQDLIKYTESGTREPGEVSLTGDVFGQKPNSPPHPWEQGLRVLPQGHPFFDKETDALRSEGMLCGVIDTATLSVCVGVRQHQMQGVGHTWETQQEAQHGEGAGHREDQGSSAQGLDDSPRAIGPGPDGD
jgi:hypothetical protein